MQTVSGQGVIALTCTVTRLSCRPGGGYEPKYFKAPKKIIYGALKNLTCTVACFCCRPGGGYEPKHLPSIGRQTQQHCLGCCDVGGRGGGGVQEGEGGDVKVVGLTCQHVVRGEVELTERLLIEYCREGGTERRIVW